MWNGQTAGLSPLNEWQQRTTVPKPNKCAICLFEFVMAELLMQTSVGMLKVNVGVGDQISVFWFLFKLC